MYFPIPICPGKVIDTSWSIVLSDGPPVDVMQHLAEKFSHFGTGCTVRFKTENGWEKVFIEKLQPDRIRANAWWIRGTDEEQQMVYILWRPIEPASSLMAKWYDLKQI